MQTVDVAWEALSTPFFMMATINELITDQRSKQNGNDLINVSVAFETIFIYVKQYSCTSLHYCGASIIKKGMQNLNNFKASLD
jgi:hypothetical protein